MNDHPKPIDGFPLCDSIAELSVRHALKEARQHLQLVVGVHANPPRWCHVFRFMRAMHAAQKAQTRVRHR